MKPLYKLNKSVFLAALWILTVALFTGGAFAQNSGAGTITGTLTDPAGSVVPGAAIAVRNINTGATVSLTTNGAGIYVAPFLPPGAYEVNASKAGFGKIARTNLTLQVGQTMTIDIALPLQTTTDTVTVSGEPSVVDTQKTDMSQVVSADPAGESAAGWPALGEFRADDAQRHYRWRKRPGLLPRYFRAL